MKINQGKPLKINNKKYIFLLFKSVLMHAGLDMT